MSLPDTLAVAAFCLLGVALTILFGGLALTRIRSAIIDWDWKDYGDALFSIGVALAALAGLLGALSVLAALIHEIGA